MWHYLFVAWLKYYSGYFATIISATNCQIILAGNNLASRRAKYDFCQQLPNTVWNQVQISGLPKAAQIKHSRCFMLGNGLFFVYRLKSSDVIYTSLPLYHITATIVSCMTLIHGPAQVVRKKFSASNFWTNSFSCWFSFSRLTEEFACGFCCEDSSSAIRSSSSLTYFSFLSRKARWAARFCALRFCLGSTEVG